MDKSPKPNPTLNHNRHSQLNDWTIEQQKQPPEVFCLKKMFLKISQFSQENTCIGVSFYKVAGLQTCNFIKKRLQHRFFPVNNAKVLRTPILKNICERLFLEQLPKNGVKLLSSIVSSTYSCNCFFN